MDPPALPQPGSLIVSIDPDAPTKGTITYRMKSADAPKGVFSSTYYFGRDFKGQDNPWSKADVYKAGLLLYAQVTERPEFEGWKLILYTDPLSLERSDVLDGSMFKTPPPADILEQHKREWTALKEHPNVIFAVVEWPEYAVGYGTDTKTTDNAILRALRLRSFVDFPSVPVFIRDADTLFENLVRAKTLSADALATWEHTLWKALVPLFKDDDGNNSYRMLIASQPSYQRQWHIHPDTGVKTCGCYAAVTSCLGNMPEWTDGSLWRECLTYMRAHTQILRHPSGERIPNNLSKPTYIGKDEQLLSYVVLREAFKRVYFYYLEYIHVEGTKIVQAAETPFATELLAAGYTRYPSPYKQVLGEPELPLDSSVGIKRKDANEITERTILKPEIIPLALSAETHRMMQIIYQYFWKQIRAAMGAPGFVSKQLGGGGGGGRNTRKHKKGLRRRASRRRRAH